MKIGFFCTICVININYKFNKIYEMCLQLRME